MSSKPVRSIVVGSLFMLFLLALLSFLVLADTTFLAYELNPGNPARISSSLLVPNITGRNFNISISITAGSAVAQNTSVSNVSFMFYLNSNGTLMGNNVTLNNLTANQTQWNITLDTTSFPDGLYRMTVMAWNYSGAGGITFAGVINDSFVNFTIDNTFPTVNYSPNLIGNAGLSDQNYTIGSLNQTIAIFASDKIRVSAGNGTIFSLFVYVSNGTQGTPFNMTTANNFSAGSGPDNYTLSLNVSNLRAGVTTIRIFANDSAGNLNTTGTFTFNVNTPPNVTIYSDGLLNLSNLGRKQMVTLNFSVLNVTHGVFVGIGQSKKMNITLEFDNASGTNFNITLGISPGFDTNLSNYTLNPTVAPFNNTNKLAGSRKFFFMRINVSQLVAGTHTVKIHANDSASNDNRSEIFTFVVDNVVPVANYSPNLIAGGEQIVGNYTVSTLNKTIAIYASDTESGRSSPGNTTIHTVVVYVSNGTQGTPFNMTTANNFSAGSGPDNYTLSLNVSNLRAGVTTIRIFANDTADNLNTTGTFTFTVNTPLNVTVWTNQSMNLSTQSVRQQVIINLSVQNQSEALAVWPVNITLGFDNASGTDFNITIINGTNVSYTLSGADFMNETSRLAGNRDFFVRAINITQLAEGLHTVTIYTNDSYGNANNTQKLTFRVDNTKPTVSVSCTSSPTEGTTVTCTCTASDDGSSVKIKGFPGGELSESTTASNPGKSTDSSTCSAVDHAGNVQTATGSWTTVAASNGGGGGGGGAAGGSSSGGGMGAAATYEKKVWTSINAGEVASVVPRNPEFSVEAVEFKVSDTVYGAWAKVEPVTKSELPAEASAQLTGKVSDTIQITINKVALKDDKVADRTVKFKVPKTWLTENSVDKNDVVLMRFDESVKKWQELATTVGEDDGTNVKYTAQTPGFSFFAIAEKGAASGATTVAPTPTGATTTAGETMAKPSTTTAPKAATPSEGGSSALWWIVAAVVLVAVVVYFVRRRKA